GAYAGRVSLVASTDYRLRVRHSDNSGDPATRWSAYAERLFSTGAGTSVFPLEMDDVASTPTPTLRDTTNATVLLPTGPTPASIRIESATGDAVLELRGGGSSNQLINPPPISSHLPMRAKIGAGDTGGNLLLPDCNLSFTDDGGEDRTVFL